MSLPENARLETGLKFFLIIKSSVAFLSSGQRRAFLSSIGKVPCCSDVFIRSITIGDSSCMTSLCTSVGIRSNSQLLDGIFLIYLVVSSMLTCLNCLIAISPGRSDISGGVTGVCESSLYLEAV